ncbi:sensor histidine kinase [Lentzea sp. JNUCC 0626]|uniref:sensor histidine kinase n=1 Tax=Lentzea sp. JNUCC 0626 TaxID=3367513 RepID=UPI003747C2FB
MPVPRASSLPSTTLRRWQHVGTDLTAAAGGLLVWGAMAAWALTGPHMDQHRHIVITTLTIDVVLGLGTIGLLAARHRYPLAAACLTAAPVGVSVSSFGPALIAMATMATGRRWSWVAATGSVWFVSLFLGTVVYAPYAVGLRITASAVAINLLLGTALFVATVAAGYYVGMRRDLAEAMHQRALATEREQALTARTAERTRIAREMHDVLTHRISLVALHAGALTYRDDLTREHAAETASIIHGNARLALSELREVLGVLRADEPSPPTLAELSALLADVHEAGGKVSLDTRGLDRALADVPESLSRTAFRIVQESLTNARKHAPGAAVEVRLSGGATLDLSIRNQITGTGHSLPSAGVGLRGLEERAALAGGVLTTNTDANIFEVRAELPWQ